MRIYVLSENLQKKLPIINRAISSRSQLPVLLNLLLEAKEGKLKISSTDLEVGIETKIPANIEEEGGITVPAKIFSELINSLPSEKITLQTKDNSIAVLSTKTKSSFQTISREEFPKLYEETGKEIIEIEKEALIKSFTKVVFAASLDTGRPALSGILVKRENDGLLLVATDGYRLSLNRYKIKFQDKEETLNKQLLIPARVIREIIFAKEQDGKVKIYISEKNNQVVFELEETVLVSRLIEAEFPVYEKIIPSNHTTRFIFDREEMQKAVKMSAIFARETANIVKFSVKNNKVTISANMPSVGENTVEVDVETTGDETEIAFNAKYILDVLTNIEEEQMVFEANGPLSPGVFKIKGDPSFLHIIMPIRVQN